MLNLKNHRSIENWKGTNFFANKNGFGAVHPNAHIDAKLDYMISWVVLEMNQTSLSTYKKLGGHDRNLKQTTFILLTQKSPVVGYIITGQKNTFATLKNFDIVLRL